MPSAECRHFGYKLANRVQFIATGALSAAAARRVREESSASSSSDEITGRGRLRTWTINVKLLAQLIVIESVFTSWLLEVIPSVSGILKVESQNV